MESPTLMFGVGATKAGTSWLHRYLAQHPQCAMPQLKELHYFNRVTSDKLPKELERLAGVHARLMGESIGANATKSARLDVRMDELAAWMEVMQRGAVEQEAYLAFLTRNMGTGTRLVGDITPAYGLMSKDTLAEMAAMASDTRFVLLLRDPLDRLWSNLRMVAGWRLKDGEDLTDKAHRLFSRAIRGKEEPVIARSDYAGMLARLQAVVPADRFHVEFYEDLFTQAAVDRLCAFLGLDPQAGDFGRRVHASPEAMLDTGVARQARDVLLPQYDYVVDQLGEVPPRWHQNREVLS